MVPKWKCKFRMIFRCFIENFDDCEVETLEFARRLTSEIPAFFVLSFQYENVYAVRDEKGYREISDTAATMLNPVP